MTVIGEMSMAVQASILGIYYQAFKFDATQQLQSQLSRIIRPLKLKAIPTSQCNALHWK